MHYEGKYNKITLDRCDRKWLRENYPYMRNADVIEHFRQEYGIVFKNNTLYVLIRPLKLKKSKEFLSSNRNSALEKARAANLENAYVPQRNAIRRLIASGKSNTFRKGETGVQRFGEEKERLRIQNARNARNTSIARDRSRVRMGLPQRTKMYLPETNLTHNEVCTRHNMLKKGYILIARDERYQKVIFYDDNTVRRPISERNAINSGFRIERLPNDL